MASIQKKGAAFYCQFYYHNKRYTVTIGKVSKRKAEAFAIGVEETLELIRTGRLIVPMQIPIADFVVVGGKVPETPVHSTITFSQLCKAYLDEHSIGSMEQNSLSTVRMHFRHFEDTLGRSFVMQGLAREHLQQHINRRAKKVVRGKLLSPTTIKKEIATLRSMWNWGVDDNRITGRFPSRNLQYPKAEEKPAFQTWSEIERRIANNASRELWECLYLQPHEIAEFLRFVKAHQTQPWVYPLCCTAAHTGARRSELLRMEVEDVDFEGGRILIREKKRQRGKYTTRHVSLSTFLRNVLKDWIPQHPGGKYLFCQHKLVCRSKKRSPTTSHKNPKDRPSTLKGRLASVYEREVGDFGPLTKDEAHDHFKRTLANSKWQVLKGFHALRHSFISALAAAAVDQRIIDEFVGHQTDQQRRRYRHLIPDVRQRAIDTVFR